MTQYNALFPQIIFTSNDILDTLFMVVCTLPAPVLDFKLQEMKGYIWLDVYLVIKQNFPFY